MISLPQDSVQRIEQYRGELIAEQLRLKDRGEAVPEPSGSPRVLERSHCIIAAVDDAMQAVERAQGRHDRSAHRGVHAER